MRLAEILLAFHNMPACDRLDLICRMLRRCAPHELRFLGTVICDATREHYENFIQGEVNANRVNHFSGFKDAGVTHEVCEKLCSALAVVHADNRPVAETVFNLLDDPRVLKLCEETTDLKILEDYRLLYIMAVNHPALSFNQKLHLMYTYLQRLDAIFSEKCRCNFSGSFSSSAEKSYSEGDMRYPPEGSIRQPGPDAYMVRCEVHSVYKRVSDKRYVFMVQVEWSDGTQNTVRRTYGDFFSFQNKLLDLFPKEAGHKHKSERVIPYLPGKKLLTPRTNRETAEKRLPELARYTRELVGLAEYITRSPHVLEFFRPREMDQNEEYPPSHKITTLYDVLESKSRHPSAPAALFKGSSTHSPVPVRRPSPLHRLIGLGGGESPPSSSVQGSRTLPHSIPTSIQQPKQEESQLERRSTFPTHRSAFTPVVASTQSQATPSAGSSLANSHPSIATTPMASNSPSPSLSASSFSVSSTGTPPTTMAYSHSSPLSSNSSLTNVVVANHLGSLPHHSCVASSSVVSCRDSTSTSTATPAAASTATTAIIASPLPRPNLQSGITTSASSLVSSQAKPAEVNNQTTTPISTAAATTASQSHGVAPAVRVPVMSVSSTSVAIVAARSTTSQMSPTTTTTTTTTVVTSPSLLSPVSQSQIQVPILSPPQHPMVTPSPPHSGASTPRDPYANAQTQLLHSQLASLGPVHFISSVSPVTPFTPAVYTMIGSPVSSPLASPKTNRWYASHNCLARMPTEYDSLFKWLKGLRLHKYSPLFENVTFEELCSFSLEQLKEKGMTAGAAKKLWIKAEELKRANFTGFRDMPFSSGMSRKPSTCSLPAALLMERGMTPSSSCEGFSPDGSTCSLDQAGHKRAASATVGTDPYGSKRDSSGSDVPPVIATFDAAIVKAVPAKVNGEISGASLSSSGFDTSAGESPVRIVNGPPRDGPSLRSASPRVPNIHTGRRPRSTTPSRSADGRTNGSVLKRSSAGSNWADDVPNDSGGVVNRPEWAHMHSGGQIRQENISGTTSPFHQMLTTHPFPATGTSTAMRHSQAIKRHSGETYSTSVIQVPSTPEHKPTQKDSGYLESSPLIAVPPSPLTGLPSTTMSPRHPNVAMNINAANWPSPGRPLLHTARASRPHPQQQNPYVNGLVWTSTPQMAGTRLPAPHPGGLLAYPGGLTNHGRNSHPVSCFNCGKRGHRGNACPGETMETKSSDAFHKQLERLARSNAAHGSQETV